jgi:beta-lactamase class D
MFRIDCKELIENLDRYFTGLNGCFILYDESNDDYFIYNKDKCTKRISPCSTFKIIHSLIGLETKVLTDVNTTFKWDGTKYPVVEWNRDQTLSSAITNSVVWYFQKVALKVGKEKEQYYLDKIAYGNRNMSGGISNFWLQSSLMISPQEQIGILRRFHHYDLPFSPRNIDIVRNMLVISRKDGTVFSGKTGSGSNGNRNINGWFVGYIEKNGGVFFFATNIEGEDEATGYKAKEITQRILSDMNLY